MVVDSHNGKPINGSIIEISRDKGLQAFHHARMDI